MLLSRGKKLTVCVLCFLLAITVVPLNIFENVNADTFISYDDEAPSSTITFRSIEDYEYNAEVKELARWTGHSNIEITFTNTGDVLSSVQPSKVTSERRGVPICFVYS